MEVTEGIGGHGGDRWKKRFGGHRGFRCEKEAKWGEHRTEVTEVTEGIGGRSASVETGASGARDRRNGESIARGEGLYLQA
jgi:hypothetical protein